VLVEFFGLPGSGKSTMSRVVAEALRQKGCAVSELTYDIDHQRSTTRSQLLKLSHIAPYAAAHPGRAVSDMARVAATRQATMRDLAKSIFNWTFISSLAVRKRSPHGVLLLDQGVAQALWSVGFAARDQSWLDLLDTSAPALRPDLVIHVRADLRAIGDRLDRRQRHASRMDGRGRDHRALARAARRAGAVLARMRAAGVEVVEVDNSDRAQLASGARAATDAITARLRALPRDARGRPLEVAAIASRQALEQHDVPGRDEGCRP
jgi:thymidylate kinase